MEPFKNIYNKKSVTKLANEIDRVASHFDKKRFLEDVLRDLAQLEMKDRVRLISKALHDHLNLPFGKAVKVLSSTIGANKVTGFMLWPISQYVEDFGLGHLKSSMGLMKKITKEFTAEFCIRKFLIQYDQKVFDILEIWKEDSNQHVRRLVSEGTRPNLPWGLKIPGLENKLSRNIELISSLRFDSSEYVRKSVANHLNDISRLDRALFLKTIKSFDEDTAQVRKLIRHASRTLLKAGDPQILKIHGYKTPSRIDTKLEIRRKKIKEGDILPIEVKISNQSKTSKKLIADYIVHFLRANGTYSQKVFRLKDFELSSGSDATVLKKISFKKVTTRKHYSGKHFLSLQINGKIFAEKEFFLEI